MGSESIGESTPVQCFGSGDDEAAFLGESSTFPITADEQQQFIQT